jgi:hypothetical protein
MLLLSSALEAIPGSIERQSSPSVTTHKSIKFGCIQCKQIVAMLEEKMMLTECATTIPGSPFVFTAASILCLVMVKKPSRSSIISGDNLCNNNI